MQEQRTLKPFNSLEIEYIHGNVRVEVGGTAAGLEIQLDDNLRPLLQVKEENGKLKLSFRDSQIYQFLFLNLISTLPTR